MSTTLQYSWRWFGPQDPIPLAHIRQAGATYIVTALHHLPNGTIWPIDEIQKRKSQIESAGLTWSVVESVPIHEDIKRAAPAGQTYLANYAQTLRNLAACGIHLICYNFMPILDWTRTNLAYILPTGAEALRFDAIDAALFDLYLLQRPAAAQDHPPTRILAARIRHTQSTPDQLDQLQRTILMGLPGTVDDFTLEDFRAALATYSDITTDHLRQNHIAFLQYIIPIAEECRSALAIHPDDPPFPIFGLPRIASTEADLTRIITAVDSPANGITFCTGSLGANPINDLPAMARRLRHRIFFLHLRNVQREPDGSFYESDHLAGSANLPAVLSAFLEPPTYHQRPTDPSSMSWHLRPADAPASDLPIILPLRPDHGHRILNDLTNPHFYPGYSALGRLKALAELRGLEQGLRYAMHI